MRQWHKQPVNTVLHRRLERQQPAFCRFNAISMLYDRWARKQVLKTRQKRFVYVFAAEFANYFVMIWFNVYTSLVQHNVCIDPSAGAAAENPPKNIRIYSNTVQLVTCCLDIALNDLLHLNYKFVILRIGRKNTSNWNISLSPFVGLVFMSQVGLKPPFGLKSLRNPLKYSNHGYAIIVDFCVT